MQIRLTVLGPRSGHSTRACDVLVTAPAGTALAAVASSLAAAVAGSGADVGATSSTGSSTSGGAAPGGTSGPVVLYAGSERLDTQRAAIGEPPLIDGAVLSLHGPGPAPAHGLPPQGTTRLQVVSGPDAGGVHLLHGGQIRIGRSADADVPLDDPDVSRLHCAVTVEQDGSITVADLRSTNGTVLDGTEVDEVPAPMRPGTLLRIGESALRLHPSPTAPDPCLESTPDGEGHLRVSPASAPGVPGIRPATHDTAPGGHASGAHASGGTPPAYDAPGRPAAAEGRIPAPAAPGAHATAGARSASAQPTAHATGPYTPQSAAQPERAPQPAPAEAAGAGAGAAPREDLHSEPAAPAEWPVHQGFSGPAAPMDGPAPGSCGSAAPAEAPPAWASSARRGTPVRGTSTADLGPGFPDRSAAEPSDAPAPGAPAPYAPATDDETHGGQQDLSSGAAPRKGGRRGGLGAWARRLAGGRPAAERPGSAPADPSAPAWRQPDQPPGAGADGGAALPAEHLAAASSAEGPDPAAAHERCPDPATVLLTALGPGPRLWERGTDHPDALTVRLGTAAQPGGRGAVPVTVELRKAGALGLAGPRPRLAGLARSAVAQLAALHSPTALEIVLISTDRSRHVEDRLADWAWLGWLPQVRPSHGQDCRLLLAYDKEQAAARTSELVRRLDDGPLGPGWPSAERSAVAAAAARHHGPYTVVVVDGDPGTAALRETVARLAAGGPAAGIHLLCLAETPAATPAFPLAATYEAARAASPGFGECGAVAVLSGDVATALRVIQPGTSPNGTVATVDAVSPAWAERIARALSPLRETDSGAAGRPARRAAVPLPESSRLLDELGLARATPASLMARWAAAADGDRPGAMAVLGAGPHGPLCADLAGEEGSHLLLEGATGSGKTELLRSVAASLAAADRPDRLTLVLVDGGGSERGEGLRVCTDLPHVTTYLAASDPVRMRAFAQALTSELKRRAEILGGTGFAEWRAKHQCAPRVVAPRRSAEGSFEVQRADADSSSTGTLRLRARGADPAPPAEESSAPMPRLFVLVDDFDALVSPALGSTGRPAAGSVVRALEAVARDGAALGVHLIAATGHPDRTADTATAQHAGLRVELGFPGDPADPVPPGRGRLHLAEDDSSTPFQAGRVTGRIPRTSTLRPTVVPLEWQRMGDPPARRPLRELGNGPTDLALLASALQRAAGSTTVPPLL